MSEQAKIFSKAAEIKVNDLNHRKIINKNISVYNNALNNNSLFKNIELAKQRASNIKCKVINELEGYLKEFELNFTNHGGKIIWALDSTEAVTEIIKILNKNDVSTVVKSKSMVTEEIEFNHEAEKQNIKSVETDLGEFIVQVAGEKPYHIVTPAMHKSKEEIAELFNKLYDLPPSSSPEKITAFVRTKLREEFINAGAGITGANFLIADTGSVAVTENEGNGVMTMSFPKIHIVVTGIEKLIPSIKDVSHLWPLLSYHGTGQNVTAYNSIISGPKQEGEIDGPDEMYVVLLDNNRTELLKKVDQRLALSCIKCGACLNGCPVYRNIGGYTYGYIYGGPIGAVIAPHMKGMKEYSHLSFASSLCGKCTEVCPVKIKLHKMLLYNRRDAVEDGNARKSERILAYTLKKFLKKRWLMDKFSYKYKNAALNLCIKNSWGKKRTMPGFAEKSFNKQWKEARGLE
jgi:L-lactate dehydrogenase complex protein LldF